MDENLSRRGPDMASILEVRNLQVSYHSQSQPPGRAIAGVTFDLAAGEILGLLGESGSGKSTLAASLLRLLPTNADITGKVLLEEHDILCAQADELQRLRGGRISLIFQEPSLALHPTMRVGDQISEVLRAHTNLDPSARHERTFEVLRSVFASDVDRIASSYPHQLSGGQRQRVLIAQAIACRPAVLVADEPTSSLDAATQREILSLLRKLRDALGLAIIFITHNPALLPEFADRVLVLYAGKVAELGSARDVLFAPHHPYTQGLLRSTPASLEGSVAKRKAPLPAIPGSPPNLSFLPKGCAFEPRCADRMEVCRTCDPAGVAVSTRHEVSCLKFSN